MSSTIKHFSHPEHELILKENDVIEDTATCYVCNRTVIGKPTYTCTSRHAAADADDDIGCKMFYLHQTCAELPPHLFQHSMHNQHTLTLELCFVRTYCNSCDLQIKFAYRCRPCNSGICVACAFPGPSVEEQRELHHEGHQEHTLVLQRQALFKCDACWVKAEDYSYVCKSCDFWIHKKCALSPPIIAEPANHHHPLHLIFSIPDEHRYFGRWCNICDEYVPVHSWMYYCQKCTYFVHMKCVTSPAINETEAAGSDNDPDLIEFPLRSEEALSDFMITQFSKFQVDFEAEHKDAAIALTRPNDQHKIEEHWSHPDHPLQLFQFIINEHDNDDEDDQDTTELICDGCIQPITVTHPSYYGCNQCNFFLHSVCATKLPKQLPVGVSSSHPQHSLALLRETRFYKEVECGVCGCSTNGFYYECEACDMKIDICCAFLPSRIKYKSHKHHPFILRPSSADLCSVSRNKITGGVEYGCEICSNFQIIVSTVFYPSMMKHKYDDHSITLRYPPFFYEGVFYCELCEEQVNNQWWLYHCDESDHSFHSACLHMPIRTKLGGTIRLDINDQMHTLAFVFKRNARRNAPLYICYICDDGYTYGAFFECDGCGILICDQCVRGIDGD